MMNGVFFALWHLDHDAYTQILFKFIKIRAIEE